MSKLDRFKKKAERRPGQTDAEKALWESLYRIPLEGSHFRRQVEIGPYRADFALMRLKLLIEVDGKIHDAQRAQDEARTNWLENEGYRVIRFSNLEVTTDMNMVLAVIGQAIAEQMAALGHPTPALRADPPPPGEGEKSTPALARRPSPSRAG